MKKYEVFWRAVVEADDPKQAAESACKDLGDVTPTEFTVLETDEYTFWNVDLEAEKQVTMVVSLDKKDPLLPEKP
jgi:hypothetical protein